ncbi:hypothetical protein N2V14_004096 [Vibrio fluvialis]|nr:hypothetical protein [Vibrio fluvialis]
MDKHLVDMIKGRGLKVEDVAPIIEEVERRSAQPVTTVQQATIALREAIQEAESFGLVRTAHGSVITGALASDHGVVLVSD